MMGFFFTMLWRGGLIPAYRHARRNLTEERGEFGFWEGLSAALNTLVWPMDLGWHLASVYCEEHKG